MARHCAAGREDDQQDGRDQKGCDGERWTEEEEELEGNNRCNAIYVECRLHPITVKSLLAAASSKGVSKAWRTGKAIPGERNVIKLVPHTTVGERCFVADQGLYDEGREWWEAS